MSRNAWQNLYMFLNALAGISKTAKNERFKLNPDDKKS